MVQLADSRLPGLHVVTFKKLQLANSRRLPIHCHINTSWPGHLAYKHHPVIKIIGRIAKNNAQVSLPALERVFRKMYAFGADSDYISPVGSAGPVEKKLLKEIAPCNAL